MRGEARGEVKQCARTLLQVLARRVGDLDPAVVARLRSVASLNLVARAIRDFQRIQL